MVAQNPTWLRPEKLLEMIVWQGGLIKPRIPLRVAYEVERRGNKPFEALGQRTHTRKSGTRTVRRRCICQHKAEMGLGLPLALKSILNKQFLAVHTEPHETAESDQTHAVEA